MARTIAEIQSSIVAAKNADPILAGLTSTSAVAIWWLWTWVVATSQWTLENLYDAHVSEVQGIIATQKPHTLEWYATMAKAFQYGIALPVDTDVYTVVPPVDASVLIVSYAAAVELTGMVRIKAAQAVGTVLGPLSAAQLTSFTTYMNRIKDAGVLLQVTSGNADNLQLALDVYYDPLVLNNTGARIDGTSATPVTDAITGFLGNLPFNGVFMLNSLVATGQAIDGVVIFEITGAQANYALTPYVNIITSTPSIYVPDAGYLALDITYFNAHVNFLPYTN